MSSRKGVGQPSSGGATKSSLKGNGGVDQLTHGVGDMSLDPAQDDGWEVFSKKNKNKTAKPWNPQNSNPKQWGYPDGQKVGLWGNGGSGKGPSNAWTTQTAGRGNTRNPSFNTGRGNHYSAPTPAIPPPLESGWNWNARPASTDSSSDAHKLDGEDVKLPEMNDDEDEVDDVYESDDELQSDDYDSDESQKSHDTRKKSTWFMAFFEILDSLTVEQINEPARQWHCPACQNGPGSIDWYRSLQALITHAKTKGSKRVKRHRDFAELLDEELRRRGTSAVPAGEAFGKWKGLAEVVIDKEIVWPPMVVIMNTRLEQVENEKWLGMGNQELLDYFSSYSASKARHSYGPQGHQGMSVLIFDASAVGYLEAERLSKHFEDQGTSRDDWDRRPVLFGLGGNRQLYGFMAEKGDLDMFNQHSQGKSKLKFEMRSYQEMVVNQMKQMSEDNQQLTWYKNKVAKEQRHSKALEESFGLVSEKLRKTLEENRIVRQRTQMHHQQNKEEMDIQEQFLKEQMKIVLEARFAQEDDFEKIQQEERKKVKQSFANPSSVEDPWRREEKLEKFIKSQDEEMDEYVKERERLEKMHEEKKVELKRRHVKEEVELEEQYNAELCRLMEKYTPHHGDSNNGV